MKKRKFVSDNSEDASEEADVVADLKEKITKKIKGNEGKPIPKDNFLTTYEFTRDKLFISQFIDRETSKNIRFNDLNFEKAKLQTLNIFI